MLDTAADTMTCDSGPVQPGGTAVLAGWSYYTHGGPVSLSATAFSAAATTALSAAVVSKVVNVVDGA
ncbi:hypothetical protein [Amycolatopsis magusensis]|uniref:hypothetical protein n=1 Tax=Amycolatopsis magusensis TaxID=882444 RepID=UPI003C2EA413